MKAFCQHNPIFKGEVTNYRPVSLTSVFRKIIQRIISDCILERKAWLVTGQCCFCRGAASCRNIPGIRLRNKPRWRNRCYYKSTDVVLHDIYVEKLYKADIDRRLVHWFKEFLNAKTQRVKISRQLSVERPEFDFFPVNKLYVL